MEFLKCLFMYHYRPRPLEEPVPQAFASPMADRGLSCMLSGVAGYKSEPTQFLDLLFIIKPVYVTLLSIILEGMPSPISDISKMSSAYSTSLIF